MEHMKKLVTNIHATSDIMWQKGMRDKEARNKHQLQTD